jgi:hypothetical protein
MRKILPALLLVVVLAFTSVSCKTTDVAQARTVRLFLIGNSFSENASQHLPQLAKDGGHELIIGRAEAPGHSLQQHWAAVEAAEANPNDAKGKIYRGKSLRELLSAGTWDIVTIQQASINSGYLDSYHPYAQNLYNFIKKLQPNAEVVIHETWPYRSDSRDFSYVAANGVQAGSDREMFEKLMASYHTVAGELGVRLIPVGEAFWRVNSNPQWGYKKDTNFDFEHPVFPNLPDQTNSLNAGYRWEGQTKLGFDSHHSSEAGKYLGALVWYGFLFDESPEKVTFVPSGVPAPFAAYLRQVAALALNKPSANAIANAVAPAVAPVVAATPATTTKTATQTSTPQPATAQPTTSSGKPGLVASADTSIRGGSYSTRAFGSLPILRVRNTPNLEHARKAYIRFDTNALPQGIKNAKNATVNLTVGPAENNSLADKVWTFQVFGLKDGSDAENWNEGAMAWDNAAANDAQTAAGVTGDATPLGTFTLTGKGEEGKTVAFSSPELLSFLKGDSNGKVTLIITRKEAGDSAADNVIHVFASKENDHLAAPSLNVGY